MALARRGGSRLEGTIWPGFVDALTALLLILMFVLSIFMIIQFSLRERITGQDEELRTLSRELASLSNELAMETTRADDLADELGEVRATLASERSEVDRLTAALSAMTERYQGASAEADRLDAALSAMTAERDEALARTGELEGRLAEEVSEREALASALAAQRTETDEAQEAARLAAARREAMEALVADLRANAKELETANAEARAEAVRLENQRLAALARIGTLESDLAQARERAAELEGAESEAERARAEAERARADREAALARIGTLEDEKVSLLDRLSALDEERLAALERLSAVEDEKLAALERLSTLEEEKLAAIERAEAAESALTEEEEARMLEAAAARALRSRLEAQAEELDAVTMALEEARREAEQTLTLLAAAESAKAELEEQLDSRADEIDREEALRRVAESALAEAEEQTLAEQRKVALLNARVRELRTQLGALQALLDAAAERDEAQKVQIAELGQRLNQALAQKVSDLSRYQSVFFQRMEGALGGREDIQRVGDRFVFQSEVLFAPGSARLGPDGQTELAKLGQVLRDVSGEVPDDMDWILRVDGHTDRRPLSGTGRYRNNWELSFARALSVVEYLIEQEDIPPGRLAATGFGEHQPIAEGETEEAWARNRRIEFKFTQR